MVVRNAGHMVTMPVTHVKIIDDTLRRSQESVRAMTNMLTDAVKRAEQESRDIGECRDLLRNLSRESGATL